MARERVATDSEDTARLTGIDAVRGIAVFLMVEQHMGVWLWSGVRRAKLVEHWPLVGFNALGGAAAPTFITVAGVGTSLLVARYVGAGLDGLLIRRGLVLIGLGMLLNLLSPSWFSWGSWFVLHLMGFAIATAPVWRRLSSPVLLIIAAAIIAAAPFVQHALGTPPMLTNDRMRDLSVPGSPLRLWLAEGQFPIVPWLGPFLVGMVAGRAVHHGRIRDLAVLAGVPLAIGSCGVFVWRVVHDADRTALVNRAFGLALGFFPASITIVALLLGVALLLLAATLLLGRRFNIGEGNPLVCLGRASLTLLLIHVPLFRDWTRPVGLWQSLPAGATLAAIAGFLSLAFVAATAWRRIDYRYGAEWLLRSLSGRRRRRAEGATDTTTTAGNSRD